MIQKFTISRDTKKVVNNNSNKKTASWEETASIRQNILSTIDSSLKDRLKFCAGKLKLLKKLWLFSKSFQSFCKCLVQTL